MTLGDSTQTECFPYIHTHVFVCSVPRRKPAWQYQPSADLRPYESIHMLNRVFTWLTFEIKLSHFSFILVCVLY